MHSITVTNLNQGEVHETKLELAVGGDNRFMTQGQKLYVTGIITLLDTLQPNEIKRITNMHSITAVVGKCNLFSMSFKEATPDMNPSTRSKFKRKLLDNMIIHEFGKGQIMLNPYIFLPRKDKNIRNSQYMTQRLWKYTVEDQDNYIEGLDNFQDEILPNTRKLTDKLYVGTQKHGKFVDKPKQ